MNSLLRRVLARARSELAASSIPSPYDNLISKSGLRHKHSQSTRPTPRPPPQYLLLRSYSTTIARRPTRDRELPPPESAEWPRPKEIPFQPKLANTVELIGVVGTPVQSLASPDGNFWSATVINHQSSYPDSSLWIPIVFEGDLAHVAAAHLKESDCIYVSGQLTADPPPVDVGPGQAQLQVMVQVINYVKGAQMKNSVLPLQLEEVPSVKDDAFVNQSWKDLLVKPYEWWDIRSQDNSKGAAFERKDNGKLLWIDDSVPDWIQQNLQFITFDQRPRGNSGKAVVKEDDNAVMDPWKNLLANPKEWWDNRSSKHSGSINPKSPDFKRKDGSLALWLDRAPQWVLAELEGGGEIHKSKQMKQDKGEELWKDLVENPSKWWDNRLSKKNVRGPDFKRKDTGEALWLSNSPSWVLSQLPPLNNEKIFFTKR